MMPSATGAGPIAADTPVPLGSSTAPHTQALHLDLNSWLITERLWQMPGDSEDVRQGT